MPSRRSVANATHSCRRPQFFGPMPARPSHPAGRQAGPRRLRQLGDQRPLPRQPCRFRRRDATQSGRTGRHVPSRSWPRPPPWASAGAVAPPTSQVAPSARTVAPGRGRRRSDRHRPGSKRPRSPPRQCPRRRSCQEGQQHLGLASRPSSQPPQRLSRQRPRSRPQRPRSRPQLRPQPGSLQSQRSRSVPRWLHPCLCQPWPAQGCPPLRRGRTPAGERRPWTRTLSPCDAASGRGVAAWWSARLPWCSSRSWGSRPSTGQSCPGNKIGRRCQALPWRCRIGRTPPTRRSPAPDLRPSPTGPRSRLPSRRRHVLPRPGQRRPSPRQPRGRRLALPRRRPRHPSRASWPRALTPGLRPQPTRVSPPVPVAAGDQGRPMRPRKAVRA